jgi:putative DNA primase/helicase
MDSSKDEGSLLTAESIFEAVNRLAGLHPLQYEMTRMAEAKRFNIRISLLDKAVSDARTNAEKLEEATPESPDSTIPSDDGLEGDELLNGDEVREGVFEAVKRLALLDPLEYETVRHSVARNHGIRTVELDKAVAAKRTDPLGDKKSASLFAEVVPWPEPIDASALLGEIEATVHRFIVCNEDSGILVALWIAFTWIVDLVRISPILLITAPEKRCGKTQLLDLIGRMSCRSVMASNISPAAVYRVISAYSPTLLLDEADTFLRDNEQLRGVLNSGHTRSGAYVIRVEGDDHQVEIYSTWGPKAISGIGSMPDTLMDRSVIVSLRRKLSSETVERLRYDTMPIFEVMKSKLARLASDAAKYIESAEPVPQVGLNDRAQDNWEPLLAIADYAGGNWPERARSAAIGTSQIVSVPISETTELLSDISQVFETMKCEKIWTADLLGALINDDSKRWGNYANGKPLTAIQLASKLREFSISPISLNIGDVTRRGYRYSDFHDVLRRYLDPVDPRSESPLPAEM